MKKVIMLVGAMLVLSSTTAFAELVQQFKNPAFE
jgi:hypothetical protein